MILWNANFKSINGASLFFSMNRNATSDTMPITRNIQNRLTVSALPPKKVMLSMNVLTAEYIPPPGTPGPFSLSDENSLKNSFVISGFKNLSIERTNVSFDFDSPDDFTTFITETAGPLQKMLANQTIERKREILKAVTEAAQKYVDNNTGKVSFENEAILIASKK